MEETTNDMISFMKKITELEEKVNYYEAINCIKQSDIILGELLYTRHDDVRIYVSEARKLISNVSHWQFNRALDEDHVNTLEKVIVDGVYLEGSIDLLETKEGLCVVNGQHRVEALQKILNKDDTFKYDLIVNVHPVESFDCERANEIFMATNNIKNVETRDKPQEKIQNVCKRIKDRYPFAITENKSGKANLHRMDIKELYNILQYNDEFNDPDKKEDYLFQKFVDLNTKLSNTSYKDLMGRQTAKKDKMYDGACRENFYFGLLKNTKRNIEFTKHFNDN
tara:strand:+ start:78 stop:920 length:843 start_codon:yes stop_codon:yes gene_type:complete